MPLMKLLSLKYHEKHFNLIVNMVQNEQEALDVFHKLSVVSNRYLDISIDYTGSIPYDPQMKEAIRKQQVFVDRFSSSRTSTAFTHLAERMATTASPNSPKGTIQFFWRKLFDIHEPER